MTPLMKFTPRRAAATIVAAALGASALAATAAADSMPTTPSGTTPTGTAATPAWNPAAISPADGAAIRNGEPEFRWQVPSADAYSPSGIVAIEAQKAHVTRTGRLTDPSNVGQVLGDSLNWPRHQYIWKNEGASPLLAGKYLWQVQTQDQNTGQEDDMPVRSFTVPGWIRLGHLRADVYPDAAAGNDIIQFVGHLLGNINNQDSMDAHPKDPRAQFVCAGTGTFKLGRRTVLVQHEKQDCSSAVAEWGQVVFSVHNTQIKAPAGAHLTAQLTVSGDGVTVTSNPMRFIQP